MRETNFRSALANRASVSITTTLYDRRALDCTSDRPLINSLNHLSYLTSSSARVRETLCFDGGLERLVAILKECRLPADISSHNKTSNVGTNNEASIAPGDPALISWKWSLALQCLLFLGTRGTENIRRRVVEAGVIPVISTVLDNYLEMINNGGPEECDDVRCCDQQCRNSALTLDRATESDTAGEDSTNEDAISRTAVSLTPTSVVGVNGPVDVAALAARNNSMTGAGAEPETAAAVAAGAAAEQLLAGDQWSSLVTDIDAVRNRAHSQTPAGQFRDAAPAHELPTVLITSTSTSAPARTQPVNYRELIVQMFGPGDSPAMSPLTVPRLLTAEPTLLPLTAPAPGHRLYAGRALAPREEDVIWSLEILAFVSKYAYLKPKFQNSHLVPRLSMRDPTQPPLVRADLASQRQAEAARTAVTYVDSEEVMEIDIDADVALPDAYGNSEAPATVMPHSGVCPAETAELHGHYSDYDFEAEGDIDPEYESETLNVFPLVEQLTARKFPREVPYWAGIIMRNSCRKDEHRGGIRQCANFACGKWENYPRHFAKCRQCKRTKYCSKECQLAAWPLHRYWCTPSTASNPSSSSAQAAAHAASAERPQSVGQGVGIAPTPTQLARGPGGPGAGAAIAAAAPTVAAPAQLGLAAMRGAPAAGAPLQQVLHADAAAAALSHTS